jgi:hypothetical protein
MSWQGDVGSGKTAVAFLALLAAVGSGQQAALMAPTEALASQHAVRMQELLEALPDVLPGGQRRPRAALLMGPVRPASPCATSPDGPGAPRLALRHLPVYACRRHHFVLCTHTAFPTFC